MKYNNIEKLRKILINELKKYKGDELIKLPFEEKLLSNLLFSKGHFAQSLEFLLEIIDFSNVNFQGFVASNYNFSDLNGVKINPQTIRNKDLTGAICNKVEFIGPFDNVNVFKTNFEGSKGAKINPQTVFAKNLSFAKLSDVQIIGSFDDVRIYNTDFTGSKGVKPQLKDICSKTIETKVNLSNEDIELEEEFRQKVRTLIFEKNK